MKVVTVVPDGKVWGWCRSQYGVDGRIFSRHRSRELFRTLAEAVDAAQSIARCYGARYAGVEVAS